MTICLLSEAACLTKLNVNMHAPAKEKENSQCPAEQILQP